MGNGIQETKKTIMISMIPPSISGHNIFRLMQYGKLILQRIIVVLRSVRLLTSPFRLKGLKYIFNYTGVA